MVPPLPQLSDQLWKGKLGAMVPPLPQLSDQWWKGKLPGRWFHRYHNLVSSGERRVVGGGKGSWGDGGVSSGSHGDVRVDERIVSIPNVFDGEEDIVVELGADEWVHLVEVRQQPKYPTAKGCKHQNRLDYSFIRAFSKYEW